MKNQTFTIAVFACALFLATSSAYGQQFDAAFGFNALTAPSSTFTSSTFTPSVSGGLYPSFSADFLLKHHFGVGAEVAWRARQGLYGGYQPYRPLFYDFNAIWVPTISKKVSGELMAGIGGEDLRFYQGFYQCNFVSCTNYVSSNHFMEHLGAGLRLYVWGHVFVRPEAHLYFVNNNREFSSNHSSRYGVSIGYTFGPGF
ncbi:MAG: hypothetical protein M3O09_01805 [Acidobacteriota bacterium]|nr:hypothetical protein [Acidobacteriota bacterium]